MQRNGGATILLFIFTFIIAQHTLLATTCNMLKSLQKVQTSCNQICILSTDFQRNAQYQPSRKSVQ